MNESVIQKYIDPSGSLAPSAVPATRIDLARSILPESPNEGRSIRVALLVKSMEKSGGNRVIGDLFDGLSGFQGTEIHVFVVPETAPRIGEVRNLVLAKRRYRAAASVTRAWRAVNPGEFDLVISTSRRTLDFVADLAHPAHVHLFQAIEAWDSVNSAPFLAHCRDHRYPSPVECIDLIREIGLPQDLRYLDQIGAVGRIRTVSAYLNSAVRYAARPRETVVCEPKLFVRGAGGRALRQIDLLLFLRGDAYNGDALSVEIASGLQDRCPRIVAVVAPKATSSLRRIRKQGHVSMVPNQPDAALAELFASARVVLHPSLCHGGGFIPVEALSFGCTVVASRTGWLLSARCSDHLVVVDRHDPDLYRQELARVLGPESPIRSASCSDRRQETAD